MFKIYVYDIKHIRVKIWKGQCYDQWSVSIINFIKNVNIFLHCLSHIKMLSVQKTIRYAFVKKKWTVSNLLGKKTIFIELLSRIILDKVKNVLYLI